MLRVSFEHVGLTPGGMYDLYIDPKSHLIRRWDYMPTPAEKTTGTWEGYKDFKGLKLATEHKMGARRIYFTDVSVQTSRCRLLGDGARADGRSRHDKSAGSAFLQELVGRF